MFTLQSSFIEVFPLLQLVVLLGQCPSSTWSSLWAICQVLPHRFNVLSGCAEVEFPVHKVGFGYHFTTQLQCFCTCN
jgi:hypothetical protein